MSTIKSTTPIIMFIAMFFSLPLSADTPEDVSYLQSEWAKIYYQMPKAERAEALARLATEAEDLVNRESESAEALIWQGIIYSTWAAEKGGLDALKLIKKAKRTLENALKIDADALAGSAWTSLGVLYYQVPGKPVCFGDENKARTHLQEGLRRDPHGIDSNFFYGDFLLNHKEFEAASKFFQTALNAPARKGQEIADQGRRKEIRNKLTELYAHLN